MQCRHPSSTHFLHTAIAVVALQTHLVQTSIFPTHFFSSCSCSAFILFDIYFTHMRCSHGNRSALPHAPTLTCAHACPAPHTARKAFGRSCNPTPFQHISVPACVCFRFIVARISMHWIHSTCRFKFIEVLSILKGWVGPTFLKGKFDSLYFYHLT